MSDRRSHLRMPGALLLAILMAVPILPTNLADPAEPDFAFLFIPATFKVKPFDALPATSAVFDGTTVVLAAARGEHEAFQAVFEVGDNATGNISLSPPEGTAGSLPASCIEYFQVCYPTAVDTQWPDPLIPLAPKAELNFTPGRHNAFLIDLFVPRDAPFGKYSANLTIRTSSLGGFITVPVELTVWNITLPETPTLRTWFDDSSSSWASYYSYAPWSSQHQDLMKNVYKQYKKFGISPGNIALGQVGRYNMTVSNGVVSVDFSGTDPWLEYCLDGLGFTNFRFPLTGYSPRRADRPPGSGHPDEMYFWGDPPYDMNPTYADHIGQYIKLVADHYRQKGWLDKSYVYVTDEPIAFNDDVTSYWQHPDYHVVQQFYNLTKSKAPDLKFANTVQLVSELFRYTDTWAVPGGSYHELDAQARMAANQSVWWYNVDAGIASPGTEGRALYWDTYSRGVHGVLYWGTNYWDYGTVNQTPWEGSYSDGDGYLFYPGKDLGIMDDVVPSLRLFLARDGIEDYELLHQYGELYGTEAARAVAESVAVGSAFAGERYRPLDDSMIYEVRKYLADRITRAPGLLTWNDTFRDAGNLSGASNLQPDFAWEGLYSLAPAYPPVAVDPLDDMGGWRPNNQPHIFSSVAIDNAVRTEGTGSLRMEFWRDDDPGELGGYEQMRNGRVVTNSIPLTDWSGYDMLEMDVRSVEHPPGNLIMLIGDSGGTVVGSALHRHARYRAGPDPNWTHVVIDISGKDRSAIQYIEPIVYNFFLEIPYHHYAYWLDNITVRKAGFKPWGSLQSKVMDIGSPVELYEGMECLSQWEPPPGTTLAFSTRSSDDNKSWSGWQPAPYDGNFTLEVASPPARYFQYSANFTSQGPNTPILSEVRLNYRPLTSIDLVIDNITFDPPVPNENETFNISVRAKNPGASDIAGAAVELSLLSLGANLSLGKVMVNMSAGGESSARLAWKAANGTYAVSARLLPPQGLSDPCPQNNEACATLFVNAYPRPAVEAPDWAFVGQEVVFNASATVDDEGAPVFRWEFQDGNCTGPMVRRAFSTAGVTSYTLTARDIRGAEASASSSIDIIARIPRPDFVVTPENGTVFTRFVFISTAYDPDAQIANHSWSFGDGARAFDRVVNHTFKKHRSYAVDYCITYYENDTLRTANLSRQVEVLDLPPEANFTISPDPANKRKVVVFDATASFDPDDILLEEGFIWSFGDGATGTGRVSHHSYLSAGLFNVSLTVTDGAGASDILTARLRVQNLLPIPDFTFPANVTVNQSAIMDASPSRDPDGTIVGYRWEFDDGTCATGRSAVHAFAIAGLHKVVLAVTDDDGESASVEKNIVVEPAISPPVRPQPSEPRSIGVGLMAGSVALLALLVVVLGLLALRRRRTVSGASGPPEVPASGPPAPEPPPPAEASPLSLPALEAAPEAEMSIYQAPAAVPEQASVAPQMVGRPRPPPPKVVRSITPPAPREAPAAGPEEARTVPQPPPRTPETPPPPETAEVPTISLEEAAGKVIELPPSSGFVYRPADGRLHPAAEPGAGTRAVDGPSPPKEEAPAEPEADPTLPYNPWGTRKR